MNLLSRTTIAAAVLAVLLASPGTAKAAPSAAFSRQPINVAFGPTSPAAEGLDDAFISFEDAAESTVRSRPNSQPSWRTSNG